MRSNQDPREVLRKPLIVGMTVVIKVGVYRTQKGVVREALTGPADLDYCTGRARYGILCAWDQATRDYAQWEIKRVKTTTP